MTRDLLIEKWNPTVTIKGNAYWFNEKSEFHRRGDQPAIVSSNGTMFWFKNGIEHRGGNKPAVVRLNGKMELWKNGEFIGPIT